ncbi:MAG: ABC transporter substrate-binding protein [Rectinema subterraneum]|uniref:ABC transporter substrate-binding protein n=1 Tax=Rectinema subterraneum TaxID=2653714 RepID=UPI003C7CB729
MKKLGLVLALLGLVLAMSVAQPVQTQAVSGPSVSGKDSLGTIVTLKAEARRVVSLAPAVTEVLFAVGAGDRIVGNTTYCDYPADAKSIEKIGGFSAKSMSIEKIISLKPDLVISSGNIHKPVTDELVRYGIPVFAYAPNTFEEIARDIQAIGVLVGKAQKAQSVVTSMLDSIAFVQKKVDAIPSDQRLTVFWEVYDSPLMTCGAATFQHALVQAAGGIDIFSDLPGFWPKVSAEEVIKRAPQVIMGAEDHGDAMSIELIAKRPGWSQIPAVKNGRIILLPSGVVSRPSPRLADGVLMAARALYPALFH